MLVGLLQKKCCEPARTNRLTSPLASGFFHLQSSEPVFSQLAAYGGSPLIQPIPLEVTEIAYSIAAKVLGIDSLSPADQVKSLLKIPAEEISAKLAGLPVPLSAALDGDVVRSKTTYTALANTPSLEKAFPGVEWCKTILLGDGQFDGMIIGLTALAHRTDNLSTSLKNCLNTIFADDPAKVKTILDGYGINDSNADKVPVFNFLNDIGFAQPAKATAEAWAGTGARLGTKSFLTHFNMPNPWPGMWQGQATHALDIAILLGNYNDFLSTGQKACSDQMSGDLLAFAYGKEPFSPYTAGNDGVSKVYKANVDASNDESNVARESDEGETGRRRILDDVAAGDPTVLDKLLDVFGLFVQGPK